MNRDDVFDADSIARARTILFVPGDRPDRFEKAAASGADEIVLDLEDAVAPGDKAAARENVRRWLAGNGLGWVRVNGVASAWHGDDLAALRAKPSVVVLPKVEHPDQVVQTMRRLPAGSLVIPVLETAAGVLDARAICGVAGVRPAFGNGDLARQLGVDHASRTALLHARSAVVLAAAAAGVAPPIDGVTTAIDDETALAADAEQASTLGFTGKFCIHPCQVPIVRRAFEPEPGRIRWARKVVATAGNGAATVVDGQMIDKAIVDQARQVLRHFST